MARCKKITRCKKNKKKSDPKQCKKQHASLPEVNARPQAQAKGDSATTGMPKEFASSIKLSRKLSLCHQPPSPSFTYQVWANKG
ncbi:hypothetical protein CEXT_322951 [Caerostris extrusa]|uniref:Uncharacterized protein n=1 Tax=Caerostris extrusa TaxID=172846 RepID=A0AAV4N4T8_CAEEX|nr:hypothetical protein CEXT_322951 [Caerostris extrusa]